MSFKMVYVFFICFCLCFMCIQASFDYENSFLDETEIVLTFAVLRHGDRAPVDMTMPYVTNKELVMELAAKTGYGQLTKSGKRRGYKVGSFLRHRYNCLLSPQYNQSEIYIRSTDSTRTKMTILTAMSAVYPIDDSWCEDVEWCFDSSWTPVPYTTESPVYDYNLAVVNCPKFITAYQDAFHGPAPEMAQYFQFLNRWSKVAGVNITKQPAKAYLISDAYYSQLSLGVPLGSEIEELLPEIEEAAGAAINVVFGNEDIIALGSGVLLKKFFDEADKLISGQRIPKVHIYSAHDVNVYTFMAVTKARPMPGAPKYGAVYALELHKVLATGQYVVKPIYLETPKAAQVDILKVEGCEGLYCDYERFRDLVSNYTLDVNEWRRLCEWSEDYDFDFQNIA